jgi:hypothetical protein
MKKYRARFNGIEEFEFVKETEKQIVFKSNRGGSDLRENKTAHWYSWHDTKDQAKEALILDMERKIESLKANIVNNENELSKIKLL